MADETQTTGTPAPEGGDAAVTPTAGTPSADGRDAGSTEPDYKEMYLGLKPKLEELNRMKEERERQPVQPAPAADTGDDIATYYSQLDTVVNDPNQSDIAVKWAKSEKVRIERDAQRDQLLSVMFDGLPSEQKEVVQEFARNRHKYGTPEAAKEALDGRRLREQNAKLQAELAAAKATSARLNANVPVTDSREALVASPKKEMTRAEWEHRQKNLPDKARMQEQVKLRRGEISIQG